MEFKETKRTWDYVYENNRFEVYHEPETNGDFITVAYCEKEHDALLISKAPEILEMLKRILKDVDFSSELWGNDAGLILREEIKQLIKEATEI